MERNLKMLDNLKKLLLNPHKMAIKNGMIEGKNVSVMGG